MAGGRCDTHLLSSRARSARRRPRVVARAVAGHAGAGAAAAFRWRFEESGARCRKRLARSTFRLAHVTTDVWAATCTCGDEKSKCPLVPFRVRVCAELAVCVLHRVCSAPCPVPGGSCRCTRAGTDTTRHTDQEARDLV